jgi:hypothetical protein
MAVPVPKIWISPHIMAKHSLPKSSPKSPLFIVVWKGIIMKFHMVTIDVARTLYLPVYTVARSVFAHMSCYLADPFIAPQEGS